MTNTNTIPSPSAFTVSPLRHRVRAELHAPVAEVWTLIGDHGRLPEYCGGIAKVEVEQQGELGARVCHFRAPDGGPGPLLRELIRWQATNLGYASSAEEGNAFGLRATLSLVTLQAVKGGTLFTWEERYENDDLTTARASFDEGIADIAQRLVARFGGRVVERWMDAPS